MSYISACLCIHSLGTLKLLSCFKAHSLYSINVFNFSPQKWDLKITSQIWKLAFLRYHLKLRAEVQSTRVIQERNLFSGVTIILFRDIVIQSSSKLNSVWLLGDHIKSMILWFYESSLQMMQWLKMICAMMNSMTNDYLMNLD